MDVDSIHPPLTAIATTGTDYGSVASDGTMR
jgi:hypothetical protein